MKKFAKLMSVVLAIAMLFAMAIPVASVAAEGGKLAIVIETVEANAGDAEVEVKLFIPAEPHWSAIDITFNFDPTKLTFVEEGFEVNEAVAKQLSGGKPSIFALNEEKAAEGEVLIAFASSVTDGGYEGYYNVDKKGNVYDYFGTFLFDVADGLEDGLYEITATVGKLVHTVGGEPVDVEYNLTKGGIEIASCDHVWVEDSRTPATCEEDGAIHYVCTKDPTHTKDEVIPALGHDWGEWEVTTPATCTEKGVETRVCKNDPTHVETRPIDIDTDAHDWDEWTVTTPATCCAEGEETRVCKNDPTHVETKPIDIDPDAHDWDEWEETTPATCEAEGEQTRVCKNDPTHVETQPITKLGHDYEETLRVAATCEADGFVDYVCKNDPEHTKHEVLTALGHDWTDWEVTVPATYEAEGEKIRTCKNDPTHIEREVIPMLTVPTVDLKDGSVFDLGKGDKAPAPTWEPKDATATLDGKPYVAGTPVEAVGEHVLVVANGEYTETIHFTVKKTEEDHGNTDTSDNGIAAIAVVALIASAAVVVFSRKKRLAK